MRTLHLTLKKKWFDMIASGEKKEEYRDLKKFWMSRLTDGLEQYQMISVARLGVKVKWKEFDHIEFRNGYGAHVPFFTVKFNGFKIGKGKRKWGAEPGKEYFIIQLGDVIR